MQNYAKYPNVVKAADWSWDIYFCDSRDNLWTLLEGFYGVKMKSD